jgi:hypothetical protein
MQKARAFTVDEQAMDVNLRAKRKRKHLPPSKICKGVELAIEISSKQKGQPLHWQHLFGLNVLN